MNPNEQPPRVDTLRGSKNALHKTDDRHYSCNLLKVKVIVNELMVGVL